LFCPNGPAGSLPQLVGVFLNLKKLVFVTLSIEASTRSTLACAVNPALTIWRCGSREPGSIRASADRQRDADDELGACSFDRGASSL
jgi:hypothetical protein